MNVYLQIIKTAWSEYGTYRLSFVLWRVRVVLQLFITYFLWQALFTGRGVLFGYTKTQMLTYIMLGIIVRPFVMGTRTQELGSIIHSGTLSNYLIRPMSVLGYFFSRDIADKLVNMVFAWIELFCIVVIFRPDIIIQPFGFIPLMTLLAMILGMVLFFYFNVLLSSLGFWTEEIWGPRFLSLILVEFFGGMFFPIDILAKPLSTLSSILPFGYFIYFPLKVYLGQLPPPALGRGFVIGLVWLGIFKILVDSMWKRGLIKYSSEGK